MMVAVAMTIVVRVFFGNETPKAGSTSHDVSAMMWLGPFTLAAAGLVTGVFPELIAKTVIEPAITACCASLAR